MDKLALIQAILGSDWKTEESAFTVGECVLICTVTRYLTGRIKAIRGSFLTLEDAAWIADTGRFTNAIKDGSLSEVEPVFDDVRVNVGSIVDVYKWKHALPREQR